jgi:multiple sugar transport system substrate-binding protein
MTDRVGPSTKEEDVHEEDIRRETGDGLADGIEEVGEKSLSRKSFVAAAAGLGLAATVPSVAGAARNAALANGLAPGKIGGPTGFPGAARYQYPADSEEGRAILALKAMKKAGKAPDQLVVQALNFARPQFQNRFPAGSTGSVQEIFERETGIKLKFVDTDPATEYQTNIRNASTKNGSFDLVTGAIEDTGDYAAAGLLRPLDDYVAKYRPSWYDKKYGYAGGASTVNLFTKYAGETYWVAFDNDTQPFIYRADLFNDPKEQANFEDRYGIPLRPPRTWSEQAKIAAFFTRPDAPTPLYGSVERKSPFWGKVNWMHRFVSAADPNQYYFKPDGSANVNNAAGIRAAAEHLRSLQWSEPGALSKDWLAQYQLFGAGNGVMGGTFPNVTKITPGNPDLDKGFGKYLRTTVQPGRIVNGKLIRRVAIHYNISYGVNNFAPKKNHEAAYLFLQWAGGARMYTYLTANPGGYQDPHHTISLSDPLVRKSYKPYTIDAFKDILPRTVPPITLRGAGEYNQALDEELQKMLTKQQSPEQAMANVERRWNAITERLGKAKQAKAVRASYAAFPPKGIYGPAT